MQKRDFQNSANRPSFRQPVYTYSRVLSLRSIIYREPPVSLIRRLWWVEKVALMTFDVIARFFIEFY